MTTLLIKNAHIVTMDDKQTEIPNGGLFIRDGIIETVGTEAQLPKSADEILDLKNHVVLPGLVNTHHHFYQTLTRAVPAAQDANLFNWLKTLYPIWAKIQPEDIFNFDSNRISRTRPFRMHHRSGSSLSISKRFKA